LHNQLGSYRSRSVQLQCGCKEHFGTYFKAGEIQSSIFQNVRLQELSDSIISSHQSSKRHCSVSQGCLRLILLQVYNIRHFFYKKKLNIFLEHNIDSGCEESVPIYKTTPRVNGTYFPPTVLRVQEIRA
jgi:hypothetical protein